MMPRPTSLLSDHPSMPCALSRTDAGARHGNKVSVLFPEVTHVSGSCRLVGQYCIRGGFSGRCDTAARGGNLETLEADPRGLRAVRFVRPMPNQQKTSGGAGAFGIWAHDEQGPLHFVMRGSHLPFNRVDGGRRGRWIVGKPGGIVGFDHDYPTIGHDGVPLEAAWMGRNHGNCRRSMVSTGDRNFLPARPTIDYGRPCLKDWGWSCHTTTKLQVSEGSAEDCGRGSDALGETFQVHARDAKIHPLIPINTGRFGPWTAVSTSDLSNFLTHVNRAFPGGYPCVR